MARIADLLEGIVGERGIAQVGAREAGSRDLIGRDVVDHGQRAAGHQHAPRLGHEGRHVGEVMRCYAAGDEFEGCIRERQRLGVGVRGRHVGEAFGGSQRGGFGEHLVRQVAGNDARHMRGERPGGVAGTSRHIQHPPVLLRLGQLDEAGEAGALGMHRGGGVGGGVRPKLLLNERLGHGRPPVPPERGRGCCALVVDRESAGVRALNSANFGPHQQVWDAGQSGHFSSSASMAASKA